MLIVQMDWFALNLAIPAIAKHFNVASTDLQWVVSGYMLSIGALMVTAGRLADIFGRRLVIVIGLAIFGIVSLICGTAPASSISSLRACSRASAPRSSSPCRSPSCRARSRARDRRARSASCWAYQSIGQALGPFVGGTFSEFFSWRGVFFINIPFCVVAIYLMLRYVKETRDENADRHIDIPGMLTVTGGLVCISLAFDRGEAWGWTSLVTVGTLVGGVLLLALFVVIEGRVRSPLVSLSLFRNRAFDAVVIAGSLSNLVFCLVAVFSAFYLQQVRSMSPFQFGTRVPRAVGGRRRSELLLGKARGEIPRGSYDGDRDADQHRRRRGLDDRDVALALHTAVLRDRGRPRARMGVDASRYPGGRARGVRGRGVRHHADFVRDACAVGVAIAAAVCELVAGSAEAAPSDAHALNVILLAGAVLAFVGAVGLMMFGRPRATPPRPGFAVA
jgi:MFS family permease